MKVWNTVKNRLPFLGALSFLQCLPARCARVRPRESREGVVSLIGENVAVGQEQDARAARRLAGEVPPAVEELPGDLKGDGCLAGPGSQRQ